MLKTSKAKNGRSQDGTSWTWKHKDLGQIMPKNLPDSGVRCSHQCTNCVLQGLSHSISPLMVLSN
jgi:hypothetical protein